MEQSSLTLTFGHLPLSAEPLGEQPPIRYSLGDWERLTENWAIATYVSESRNPDGAELPSTTRRDTLILSNLIA